jgi:predicted nucleic acid-binding protein
MKQKIITNTSPIILLAKLNALHLLRRYQVIIPASVTEEIFTKESWENDRIRKFLKNDFVEEHPLGVGASSTNLGRGEMSAIRLAIMLKARIVILDDRKAIINAEYHDLTPKGTIWIIMQAYRKKDITKKEAGELIMTLPSVGFHMSNGVFAEAVRRLKL